ncbi:MAG: alpha/beta hydrolase [Xanthobacteraceae bacterium]
MSVRAELLRLALRWSKRRSSDEPDIPALRARLARANAMIPNPPRGTQSRRVDAGGVDAVEVWTPQSRSDRMILHLHGGAYNFGSPSHYRDFTWRIASAARARVLCIDYRLAPEHPFPAALDDAVAAYRWLLSTGTLPSRLGIMGDSAGGGLLFATLLRLRAEATALPAAAVTLSPWTDLTLSGASFTRNAAAEPMLKAQQTLTLARNYVGTGDPRHPYLSPLFGDLRGLPPSLILVGSDEILLDDAVRMAERLREAGARVELEIARRMPHVWPLFARFVPESRRAVQRIGAFFSRELAATNMKLVLAP